MGLWSKITGGKWSGIIGGLIGVIAVVVVIVQVARVWRPSDAASISSDRIFVCSETGKSFHVTLTDGMTFPVHSPYSGKNTGYPAELCYWTADGQIKKEPTAVILNSWLGIKGPTFCPDCGRLVRGHNPFPEPGSTPPPTEAEYQAQHMDQDQHMDDSRNR